MQKQHNRSRGKKHQPLANVVSAGRSAFLIGTDPVNNPYRNEPQRAAWNEGFFNEMNIVEFVRPDHGAREQARRKYANPAHRLPFGDRLPDKKFKRFERPLREEASDQSNGGRRSSRA
jgi:hypothetical protein